MFESRCALQWAFVRSICPRPAMLVAVLASCCAIAPLAAAGEPLAGTEPLVETGDLAEVMIDGIHRWLDRATAASAAARERHYQRREFDSPESYARSVEPNREHLKQMLGVVDRREPVRRLERWADDRDSPLVARGPGHEIYSIRWPTLPGVSGEGLWLRPTGSPRGDWIVIPDADQTPEMLAGLAPGVPADGQIARRLAEGGFNAIVPTLINRQCEWSTTVGGQRRTNQPHREFLYRQAYEMGRTLLGYETQKALALVDWSTAGDDPNHRSTSQIGVLGYGEGGYIALLAGAIDPRIKVVGASGAFGPREGLWRQPIYRNVWRLLDEFGDAELASLIAPRTLLVEACAWPAVMGPPAPTADRKGAAPGQLETPPLEKVRSELAIAERIVSSRCPGHAAPLNLIVSGAGDGPAGSQEFVEACARALSPGAPTSAAQSALPQPVAEPLDAGRRQKRQFDELLQFTDRLVRTSPARRQEHWAKADRRSRDPAAWAASVAPYREEFEADVIGRLNAKLAPPRPRTRQIYDESSYVGYEVVLDVLDDVIAEGILLVPKGIKPGERRPVVVCQHGLEGRPRLLAEPGIDERFYHRFAGRLTEEGFITFSPQNPYIFGERFRAIQRKANPLGLTLWSFIVAQHRQALAWLQTLPQCDAERIAFYGLSYGGKTALRVPPVVAGYSAVICSGDYNEWIWKNTSLDYLGSYLGTHEYEMPEWNLGNTFNYAEMTGLVAPRPFMVERGHRDGVGLDEWVAYEFAKARLLYADLNIEDRIEIEYFDGPHTIHGVGTFDFLRRRLRWPQ